jgi:hypothetical protein
MVNVRCLLSLCYPSPSFVFLSVSIPSPTKTKHFPLPLSPSPLASYFSLFHPSLHCFTLHHRIFSLYTLLSPLYVHFRLVPANPPIVSFFTSTEATHHAGPSIARIVLQIYRGTVTLLLLWVLGGCFGDGLDSNGPITWHNQTDSFFSRDVVRWVSHLVISFFLFRTNSICILVMRLSRSGFGEWEDLVWSLVYRDARECACWFLVHTR